MTTTKATTQPLAVDPLADLRASVAVIASARLERNRAMRDAREAGATWRTIAAAAGMTEHGVRYALEHAAGQ